MLGLLLQSYSMGTLVKGAQQCAVCCNLGVLMFVQTMLLLSYGHLFLSDNFGDGYHRSMESGAAGTAPGLYRWVAFW